MKRAVVLCNKRLQEVEDEDRTLLEYANFLHTKIKDYDSLIVQLKNEVEQMKRRNAKKYKMIEEKIRDAHLLREKA